MHSGCFAATPRAGAEVIRAFLDGDLLPARSNAVNVAKFALVTCNSHYSRSSETLKQFYVFTLLEFFIKFGFSRINANLCERQQFGRGYYPENIVETNRS